MFVCLRLVLRPRHPAYGLNDRHKITRAMTHLFREKFCTLSRLYVFGDF
ncbi:MAG: hypothetical protein WDM89_05405 [Rhizomicrobium sp.]